MESMLQRHCARYIYVIPDGLRELMSDISREVLRSQPEDVYTFIADYLDALMITRENARVAARLVQSLTELATTTAIFLEETGMPRDEVDNVVTAIQKAFRRSIDSEQDGEPQGEEDDNIVVAEILADLQVSPEQANIAAAIIQQAFRQFKERKEREKEMLSGMVDWRVAARSAIHFYRKTGVSNEEANRAATLIKAAYKGYYTRKIIKAMAAIQRPPSDLEAELEYLDEEEEGEFEMESDEEGNVVKKIRSVKIDYNTVKPHVDFDTGGAAPPDQGEIAQHLSTASSIARYSLRQIFDTALDTIARQSAIPEEDNLESDDENVRLTVSLPEQAAPIPNSIVEVELIRDSSDVIKDPGNELSAEAVPVQDPSQTEGLVE